MFLIVYALILGLESIKESIMEIDHNKSYIKENNNNDLKKESVENMLVKNAYNSCNFNKVEVSSTYL